MVLALPIGMHNEIKQHRGDGPRVISRPVLLLDQKGYNSRSTIEARLCTRSYLHAFSFLWRLISRVRLSPPTRMDHQINQCLGLTNLANIFPKELSLTL